jgi:hypothetical protein
MAITISGSGITSANIADGTIVNADVADLAASKLTGALPAISGASLTGFTDAQMPTGSILQVVNGTTSTAVTTTTLDAWVDTGITATITPISTSSKIMVLINVCGIWRDSGNAWNRMMIKILRGSTQLGGTAYAQGWDRTTSENRAVGAFYSFYDSPSTTSATTYKVQFASEPLSTATALSVQKDSNSGTSNIFLQEIAG